MSKTLTMYIVYISGYTIKVAFNLKSKKWGKK